jgi:peptide chain release factor 2
VRLAELNRQAEDPNLWSDQQRAQRVMQERTGLEDQLTSISRIEQELEDQITMLELGEAEGDQKTVADAQAALEKLKIEVGRREMEALLSGEADANDSYV